MITNATDPCPRCAELEARLASFEKETFAELWARVAELEEDLARAERLQKATEQVRDEWFNECRRQTAQLVFLRKEGK